MMKNIQKAGLLAVIVLTATFASAQYYNDPYYSNYNNSGYNYGYTNYSNNPNNGITTFIGNSGYYDQNYYNNYNNNYNSNYYNSGYYTSPYANNYSQPVSVSLPYTGCTYNCNSGYYYNSGTYYNNSTLSPVTYAATNANSSGATINGYVTVSGNNYNGTYGTTWFQYGLSSGSLNWSTSPANVYGTTNTNAHLTSLSCGTTYYFRAVTSGQNGTQYGNVLSFTTSQCGYAYNNPYNNYQYYPHSYYQNWQAPQIKTTCYKPVKRLAKKYYY
jgi:hypothetical protein